MIRINLLPHREQKRHARQRRYIGLLFFSFLLSAGVVIVGYMVLQARIETQADRNRFLTEENAKLDHEIAEIEKLKSEKQALLDRKQVVERLQSNRTMAVRIMDQLVRQTPEGVYLKEFKQTGDDVSFAGFAQSSARVSIYMRSINDSDVFEQPLLIEVKSASVGNQRLAEFGLRSKLTRPEAEVVVADAKETKKGGAK
jgi:type IV pilus assembly protein PilN